MERCRRKCGQSGLESINQGSKLSLEFAFGSEKVDDRACGRISDWEKGFERLQSGKKSGCYYTTDSGR
jgi:hypothetical protein